MGSFAKDLQPGDSVAAREFIISRANALKDAPPSTGPGRPGAAAPPAPPPQRNQTGHADG